METTLLCVGFSLNFIGLGALAWAVLRRRATIAPPTETHGVRLARAALAYARQTFPGSRGDELLRHALNAFRELDLSEDGKRDYTDRQAGLYLRAVEAEK